jgi:hypothetical protein
MSEERYAQVPNMAAAHPVYKEDFDAPKQPAHDRWFNPIGISSSGVRRATLFRMKR